MVQTRAARRHGLQRELTYDGLRAAEAKGSRGGRRPAVAADKTEAVRVAYLEGCSIADLARDHGVSRGGIRTSVADLMPDHTAGDPGTTAPELPVALDMPGRVADFLRTTELRPAERAALDQGVTVRRGQGYTPRFTAVPAVHHRLLARWMAAPALRRSRPSARPTASTRTASAPSRRGHERSHRDFLYPD